MVKHDFGLRGDGKVACITGAASGLGRGVAEVFGMAGYAVALVDIDEDAGNQVARELALRDIKTLFVRADVQSGCDVEAGIQTVLANLNRLDFVFNSAGISGRGASIENLDSDDLDRVLGTNLKGVFHVCKSAVAAQRRLGGGGIVNVASITAEMGSPVYAAYAAAKAGVMSLTRGVARYTGRFNIRVNCISPGSISGTNLMRREWEHLKPESRRTGRMASLRHIPLGRFASPIDVAHVALFLASPLARHVHGSVITVDGGETLGRRG